MAEQNNINQTNNVSQTKFEEILNEDSLGIKIVNGLKSNFAFLIVVIVAILYIFSGYLNITPQFNDYKSIICGSLIGMLVGWVIKSLLGKQGIIKGLNSKKNNDVQNEYNQKCLDNAKYSEYYPAYCDIKNDEKKRNYQSSILVSVNLKYSKFLNGDYDNTKTYKNLKGEDVKFTKKQIKALKKARNPKILYVTQDYLTNEMSVDASVKEAKETTTKAYDRNRNGVTLISALLYGCIGGFFGVSLLLDASWANILWTSIQVLIYVTSGFVEYTKRYLWVTNEHVSYIKRRIAYHNEFKVMVENHNALLMAKVKQMEEECLRKEKEQIEEEKEIEKLYGKS